MTRAFAARIAARLMLFWTLPVSAQPVAAEPATQGVTNNRVRQGQLWWNLGPRSRPPSTVATRARRLLEEWGAHVTGHPTQAGPALPRRGPKDSRCRYSIKRRSAQLDLLALSVSHLDASPPRVPTCIQPQPEGEGKSG